MYESFFQLEKSPFGMTPDPSFLIIRSRIGRRYRACSMRC